MSAQGFSIDVAVVMACCGTRYSTVKETLGHECPPKNRVWTVRAGSDGIGLDLFHVYAPDMTTAREMARENAKLAGYVFGDSFTVHAHRPGEPIDWFLTLGHNIVTDRAAVDAEMPTWHGVSHDAMDAAADLLALALVGMVLDEIASTADPVTPWFKTPAGSPEREAVRQRTEAALRGPVPDGSDSLGSGFGGDYRI